MIKYFHKNIYLGIRFYNNKKSQFFLSIPFMFNHVWSNENNFKLSNFTLLTKNKKRNLIINNNVYNNKII